MRPRRLFTLHKADPDARCPLCERPTRLLCNFEITSDAFAICFACEFVGQVGVAPVTHRRQMAKIMKGDP